MSAALLACSRLDGLRDQGRQGCSGEGAGRERRPPLADRLRRARWPGAAPRDQDRPVSRRPWNVRPKPVNSAQVSPGAPAPNRPQQKMEKWQWNKPCHAPRWFILDDDFAHFIYHSLTFPASEQTDRHRGSPRKSPRKLSDYVLNARDSPMLVIKV